MDDRTCNVHCTTNRVAQQLRLATGEAVIDNHTLAQHGEMVYKITLDMSKVEENVFESVEQECKRKCFRSPSCDKRYCFIGEIHSDMTANVNRGSMRITVYTPTNQT